MNINIFDSIQQLATVAAKNAADIIRSSISERGQAYIIAATGASQFEFLSALTLAPEINWEQTTFFHLDEYVGLPETHPASFRRYLRERIMDQIRPGKFHFIEGDAPNPEAECRRVGDLISQHVIDVAFVGIGENGHLAFNDPPADFHAQSPYLIVNLDEACRQQQVGEGWFGNISEVPTQAISMSIRQIMKSKNILCIVPELRKAQAVRNCLELAVSPMHPASILQEHDRTSIFLDRESSSLLKQR